MKIQTKELNKETRYKCRILYLIRSDVLTPKFTDSSAACLEVVFMHPLLVSDVLDLIDNVAMD